MNRTRTKNVVIAAILVAICIIIPLFMPIKVIIGPYTATLASHVPILLGTFISPWIAAIVAVGSGIGFLISLGPIVGARALSHVFFALFMGYAFRKYSYRKLRNLIVVGLVGSVIHAACEVLVVIFMGTGIQNSGVILAWTFFGTMAHHMIDLAIAYVIYQALKRAKVWDM